MPEIDPTDQSRTEPVGAGPWAQVPAQERLPPPPVDTMGEPSKRSTYPVAIGVSPPPSRGDNAPPASAQDHPRQIGRYENPAFLGEGAFGRVYRAYDPKLNRDVAVKIPRPGTLDSSKRLERFLGEAKSSARLHHPHIVTVYDAGKEGDQYFIASAYIDGGTLKLAIDQGGVDVRRTVEIVRDLAEALAYAHEMDIIHRDVKPANVMLDNNGQPHLMDFGLASHLGSVQDNAKAPATIGPVLSDKDAKLTRARAGAGSPAYMSPEQWQGKVVSGASDQYNLGVLLYEMLCGETPFSGPLEILKFNAINTPPPSLGGVKPSVPLDLEAICLKTLSKRPEKRYRNCQELADDLRRWLEDDPVNARPLTTREKLVRWGRREPALVGAISLAVAAILAVAVLAIAFGFSQSSHVKALDTVVLQKEEARQDAENKEREADGLRQKAVVKQQEADGLRKDAEAKQQEADRLREDAETKEKVANRLRAEAVKREEEASINLYFNLIALIERELRDKHVERARQLLEQLVKQCPVHLRQWEYNLLDRKWQDERDRKPVNDGGNCVAFPHPQRENLKAIERFAWVSGENDLFIVDPRGRKHQPIRKAHEKKIWCVSLSPDGKFIATASADKTAQVWSADDGTKVGGALEHVGEVRWVAFCDRQGSLEVATASLDNTVKVWDLNGKLKRTYEGHSEGVCWVEYSPEGNYIASVSLDKNLRLWPVIEGKDNINAKPFTTGAFSPITAKHFYAATAGDDGSVTIYKDADTSKKVCTLPGHSGTVNRVVFTQDKNRQDRVCTLTEDGVFKVWKFGRGREPWVLLSLTQVAGFDASQSLDNRVCVMGQDRKVTIWEVEEFRDSGIKAVYDQESGGLAKIPKANPALRYEVYAKYMNCAAISGDLLATAAAVYEKDELSGEVIVWDLESGQQTRILTGVSMAWGLAFSNDKKSLALACRDGTVKIWPIDGEGPVYPVMQHSGKAKANSVVYSRDGRYLASGGDDGIVLVREIDSGATVKLDAGDGPVTCVAFSANSSLLASTSAGKNGKNGAVSIWDWKAERSLLRIEGNGGTVNSVVYSPDADGKYLAWAGSDQKIRIWDVKAGKDACPPFEGHTGEVTALAFSPDGKRLASASHDKTVKLWDVERGREALSLQGQHEFRSSLVFSPDGKRLVACTPEGIKVWDASPRKPSN
jgi:WD40 repeat protein/tRNA A-37 threonylcarbamoyl transferase component Bud32